MMVNMIQSCIPFCSSTLRRVAAIAIRQLSATEALLAGGRAEETQQATPGFHGHTGQMEPHYLSARKRRVLPPHDHAPLAWPQSVTDQEEVTAAELRADCSQFNQDIPQHTQE